MSYPFYRQIHSWDCSLACILMLTTYYHGNQFNYDQTINTTGFYNDLNLVQMQKFAENYGVILNSYFAKGSDFLRSKIKKPLVCQVRYENRFHFVVIYRRGGNQFLIADPRKQKLRGVSKEELSKIYTGIVLVSERTIQTFRKHQKLKNLLYGEGLMLPLLLTIATSLLSTLLIILSQFLLKIVVDELLIKKINETFLFGFVAFAILFISKIFFGILLSKMQLKIEINHKQWGNNKFFARLDQMDYQTQKQQGVARLLEKYQHLNEVLSFYFPFAFLFLENFLVIVVSVAILTLINPGMILLTLVFNLMIVFVSVFTLPWQNKMEHEKIEGNEKFTKAIVKSLHNQLESKRRNLHHLEQTNLRHNYRENKNVFIHYQNFNLGKKTIHQFFIFASKLVVIYFLLMWSRNNALSPGYFIFLFSLTNNVAERGKTLINHYVYSKRIQKLKTKINAFLLPKPIASSVVPLVTKKASFRFQKLNFAYDDVHGIGKKGLDIEIKTNLLIRGLPGSGKSTLLQLIAQELKPQRGNIYLNNKKISLLNLEQGNSETIFIAAKSTLYSGTILENILNFRRDQKIQRLWMEYEIDKGLEKINVKAEMVYEKNNLSSGQKQMIVFLSIFFSSARFVLIDEGLNSLSSNLRNELLKFFLAKQKEKIIFYVSHDEQLIDIFNQTTELIKNED